MKTLISGLLLALSTLAIAQESTCDRIADAVSEAIISEQTSPDTDTITSEEIREGRGHYFNDFNQFYARRSSRFQYSVIYYAKKFKRAPVLEEMKPCDRLKFMGVLMRPRKVDTFTKAEFRQAMRQVYCTFLY